MRFCRSNRWCVSTIACALYLLCFQRAFAQTNCHVDIRPSSEADVALYRTDFGTAASLYQKALTANPSDAAARAGIVQVRLRSGKFRDARTLADAFTSADSASSLAHTTRADVMASQLQLAEATAEVRKALSLDPCSARAIYVASVIEGFNKKGASEWSHLELAHKLSPNDDDITRAWMWHMPSAQRFVELQKYVESTRNMKSADLQDMRASIIRNKAVAEAQCTVTAPSGGTTVPLQHATDTGWLQVPISFGKAKRDFGIAASGSALIISEDFAKSLGLKIGQHFTTHSLYYAGTFRAWTTTIPEFQIGEITFRNCAVSVEEGSRSYGFGVIGIGIFRDFLVDLDPIGTLKISPLPSLPSTVSNAGDKWSVASADAAGFRSRLQGIWQPYDATVPPGMEKWDRFYIAGDVSVVLTQVGPGPALPFQMVWQQHFDSLSYSHEKDAVGLADTAKALGRTIPKATLDSFASSRYFVGIQGHILPVPIWNTFNYDSFNMFQEVDLAGTLGYTTLGNLRTQFNFRDGLVQFDRTKSKHFSGF